MRAYDVIYKKRNGYENTKEEIEFMINGYVSGEIPDYQMAAYLMAIYFRGMSERERYDLTMVMLNSGEKVDLSEIKGRIIDKHSTGGVGDKTTIALAPIVAAAGLKVAKLSGRGLGHTGGTIDKLESIPGFRTSLSKEEFVKIANEVGVVVAGQTANIAPADKKIYALRDATATVEEISLIASSIMSKKLAVLSDGIVLDVKVGSGAFMKEVEEAKKLANAMVDIAKRNDRKAVALVTNMEKPLGIMVGNSLEVLEAIKTVKGEGPEDFTELCLNLGAYMLYLAEIADFEEAKRILRSKIESGEAVQKMKEWIKAQGGNPEVVDDPEKVLPISENTIEFKADRSGYVFDMNTEKVGIASMVLGAGRKKKEDKIDPAVGLEVLKKTGDRVEKGEVLVRLYVGEKSEIEEALRLLKEAYIIKEEKPDEHKTKLIYDVVK